MDILLCFNFTRLRTINFRDIDFATEYRIFGPPPERLDNPQKWITDEIKKISDDDARHSRAIIIIECYPDPVSLGMLFVLSKFCDLMLISTDIRILRNGKFESTKSWFDLGLGLQIDRMEIVRKKELDQMLRMHGED